MIPVENLTQKKPDVSYFKVFGSKAWVYIPHESHENKLSPRSEIMTFVGYEPNAKAYCFMNNNNEIKVSTQAEFDESKYPRARPKNDNYTKNLDPIRPIVNDNPDNSDDNISKGKPDDNNSDGDIPPNDFYDFNIDNPSDSSDSSDDEDKWNKNDQQKDEGVELDQPVQRLEVDPPIQKSRKGRQTARPQLPLWRSERNRNPVIKPDNIYGNKPAIEIEKDILEEHDVVQGLIEELSDKEKSDPKLDVTIRYSLRANIRQHIYKVQELYTTLYHAQNKELSSMIQEHGNKFLNYLLAQAVPNSPLENAEIQSWHYWDVEKFKHSEPKIYSEWRTAMDDEIKSLNERNIWKLSDLPPGRNAIKCRWVYIIKSDGRKRLDLSPKDFLKDLDLTMMKCFRL